MEGLEGNAWWAPETGWWVRAEGRESIGDEVWRTYELILSDSGVLSAGEVSARLSDALSATALVDPEEAAVLHRQLAILGVEIVLDEE